MRAGPRRSLASLGGVEGTHLGMSSTTPSLSSARTPLEVYIIPVARDRYELYVERRVHADDGQAPTGLMGRIRARFWSLLRAAEEREDRPQDEIDETGWVARLKAWLLEWVAQRVAEQRLLWNLRGWYRGHRRPSAGHGVRSGAHAGAAGAAA